MTAPHITGCLLGTAVGDALGLPFEGLSAARVARRSPGPLKHRFLLGRGMCSDDTEHTAMVVRALFLHDTPESFQRHLGKSLRWWLAALPAGVGISTAKACIRLWLGWPAARSGVKSAGNGAAMRSAIVGAYFSNNTEQRRAYAMASCRVTHTDARAEESALIVAEAASLAAAGAENQSVLNALRPLVLSTEMRERFLKLESCLATKEDVKIYAEQIGCGLAVSGFAPNSVAVALYAWLRHRGDFTQTIEAVIRCGGDTDSVAAIAGGICGTEVGPQGIPAAWKNGIWEWPRSLRYLEGCGQALTDKASGKSGAIPYFTPLKILPRNLIFLTTVLIHGIGRIFY